MNSEIIHWNRKQQEKRQFILVAGRSEVNEEFSFGGINLYIPGRISIHSGINIHGTGEILRFKYIVRGLY